LVEVGGGVTVALVDIKNDVSSLGVGSQIRRHEGREVAGLDNANSGVRDHDQLVEFGKLHHQLDSVELEGDQRQSIAGVLREPERKRDEKALVLLGVLNELATGLALADHLGETLSSLSGQLLPHVEVVREERGRNIGSDDNRGVLDDTLPNSVLPVGPGDGSGTRSVASGGEELVAERRGV